jgi:hypothetical protein
VQFATRVGSIFIKDNVAALIVIHAGETFHEVADLLPLVVVTLQKISAMLDGHDHCATIANLRLGGKGQEGTCPQRYDRGDWRLRWGLVLVVTQWTGVKDAVRLLVVLDRLVAKVDGRFGSASGKFGGILVHVVEVVLALD